MISPNASVRWLREHPVRWLREHLWHLGGVLVVAFGIAAIFLIVSIRSADRREYGRENRRSIVELCDAINKLPSTLAEALAVRDRLTRITGPTTTIARSDLTPEQQAEVRQLSAELAEMVARLGDPVDCYPDDD